LLSRSHALRGNTVKARYAVSHDPCTQLQIGYINTRRNASILHSHAARGNENRRVERRKFADGKRLIPYASPSTVLELSAGIGVGRNKTIQAHSARWRFRRIGEAFAGNTGFSCRSNRLTGLPLS